MRRAISSMSASSIPGCSGVGSASGWRAMATSRYCRSGSSPNRLATRRRRAAVTGSAAMTPRSSSRAARRASASRARSSRSVVRNPSVTTSEVSSFQSRIRRPSVPRSSPERWPARIASTARLQRSRRVVPYRARMRTRRSCCRAATAPTVRWMATTVSRSSLPALSSRSASASRASSEAASMTRAALIGPRASRTRTRSASMAAARSSSDAKAASSVTEPIRTAGRTVSIGSCSAAATASASSSPRGSATRIDSHCSMSPVWQREGKRGAAFGACHRANGCPLDATKPAGFSRSWRAR